MTDVKNKQFRYDWQIFEIFEIQIFSNNVQIHSLIAKYLLFMLFI
jgi:hypothetical protein